MFPSFDWPLPDSFTIATPPSGVEAVMLAMVDGARHVGTLVDFRKDARSVEVLITNASLPCHVGFGDFKALRLTRPITLKRHESGQSLKHQGADALQRQRCMIRFHDGENLAVELIGLVENEIGLFLFSGGYGQDVLRSFVPHTAIAAFEIAGQASPVMVDTKSAAVAPSGAQGLAPVTNQEELEHAFQIQKELPHVRIGEALLQENLITASNLEEALARQAKDKTVQLGEILVAMGVVKRETIRRILIQKLGIPYVLLGHFNVDPNLIKLVPSDLVRQHGILPLYRTENRIVAASENPLAVEGRQALGFFTKLKVDVAIVTSEDLDAAIRKHYGGQTGKQSMQDLVLELGTGDTNAAAAAKAQAGEISDSDNVLVRLVNKIITDAYDDGASDIHIENLKDQQPTKIRFRKDGIMFDYSEVPANFRNALVSRLKIMSRLDISERRRPQDGKIDFSQFSPTKIELRVLTMPTTDGLEDVVMRILAAPRAVSLETLGLADYALAGLKKIAERPHGLLFVCGPTGSGKTTTLHSILSHINTPDRKIWTVEDPIEITQRGLRQVQVQNKIDLTFAAVLRSFLRADPDVIMVGETRDPETARTVIEASLTGHLVFSTMHTNSAAESVVRLLDLGLDPFNFADALLGVVGQRLARRLCTSCRSPYAAGDDELNMLAHEYCEGTDIDQKELVAQWRPRHGGAVGKIILYRAKGCEHCNNTGYKGRLGIHELLMNTSAIKSMILAKNNVTEMTRAAVGEGMATLRQDGINKILLGLTDWEQIRTI